MNDRFDTDFGHLADGASGRESLAERLLHALLQVSDDAAIVIDWRRRIVLFNAGAAAMFGYRSEEVLGREVELLLPVELRERHAQHVRNFDASAQPSRRMGERGEIVGRRASGELFPAEASISQVTISGLKFFAAIVRDVSDRKRAEIVLRASEERFRALAESAPVGIFEADETGRFVYVNACWQQIAGMRGDEAVGEGWARAIHPEDRSRVYLQWRAAVEAGDRFDAEFRCLRPDGTESFVLATAVAGSPGFVGTVIDVTEQRRQAAATEAARHEAEAAAKAKSLFLANMSHEIRTPLNAVIGMTGLLLDTPISEEQRDFAHTIRSSGEALLAIINDVLDFSKADLGKLELERQAFDLRRVIEDSLDLNAAPAAEKRLNLAYVIEEGTPATLVGDATRLRQILVNLVNNAVKFTHHGEVTVTVDAVQIDDGRFRVHFAVRDTGIGIAPDRLHSLFHSFSQVDASTTRRYGGTGLGLAISRRLAELMGGHAWAESEPGAGSVFHFAIVGESGPSPDHQYLRLSPPALAGKRLLIVDDNTTNRRILVKQALLWGMRPTATPSAIEALDLVRHGHVFDVAVLDMGMPDMSGIDLAWEIRRQVDRARLPIVILTSMGARFELPTDTELGLSALLSKPIKPAQLYGALAAALGGMIEHLGTRRTEAVDTRLAEQMPLRILVAEDNAVNQKVVLRMLEKIGYRADVAGNGLEVLDALERQRYDVILMDLHMPEMDGIEATRRIYRRHDRHEAPRVIGMTASVLSGERERCLAAGMDAFVSKPIERDALAAALMGLGRPRGPRPGEHAPAIDRERLVYLSGLQDHNSKGLVHELIDMFVRDAPEHLDALRRACAARALGELRQTAHRLKSSADNLGARGIAQHCDVLEALDSVERLGEAESVLAEMAREFERARDALLVARRSL